MFLGSCAEPDHEGCEGDGAEVDVGAFVVAGGDGTEAFEAVDGAFDGVAFLVALAVESGGPTASGSSVLAVSLLVEALGDVMRDCASSQVAAVLPGRVRLVRQYAVGPGAGPSGSGAGNGDLFQHPLELRAVTVVAGGQEEGEGPAPSFGGKVDFGGETAAGAAQAFAEVTTSSSRAASFRKTGSARFVPRPAPF